MSSIENGQVPIILKKHMYRAHVWTLRQAREPAQPSFEGAVTIVPQPESSEGGWP
jgi:hypothetical protein